MSNAGEKSTTDLGKPEANLRGSGVEGAEQRSSADHEAYRKSRKPDTELRVDGEKDDLYSDGLDVDEETDTLAGTRGLGSAGAKPV